MSTLRNTTWDIIFGSKTVFNINFNEDGSAAVMFPEGSCAAAYWTEGADGKFMFRTSRPCDTVSMNEAFFGIFDEREGSGHWCEAVSGLHGFRMTRRQ